MSIQWFPGHMFKAKKKIAEVMKDVDLVIEILDARLPYSSENPMARRLRKNTPTLSLLNKADLADPKVTQQWLEFIQAGRPLPYNSENSTPTIIDPHQISDALPFNALDAKQIKSLVTKLQTIAKTTLPPSKSTLRTMVMGIPNVGKSTLLNMLAGRPAAKVGNQPAVTKDQMRIKIADNITLIDTPGMLWPKIEDPESGYRLAASGAIRNTAYDPCDVGIFAGDFMLEHYASGVMQRYKLDQIPKNGEELLTWAAKKRGCIRKGGIVDLYKISDLFLSELRAGKLGTISFETPGDIPLPIEEEDEEALEDQTSSANISHNKSSDDSL